MKTYFETNTLDVKYKLSLQIKFLTITQLLKAGIFRDLPLLNIFEQTE
jgi:hypothetical protein